jgi:hypothetical protein
MRVFVTPAFVTFLFTTFVLNAKFPYSVSEQHYNFRATVIPYLRCCALGGLLSDPYIVRNACEFVMTMLKMFSTL